MVRDYNGFSYRPYYGFALYDNNDKLIKEKEDVPDAWCFSSAFYYLSKSTQKIFKGVYTLKCFKYFEEESGNYCSLSKNQILKMLRYMRRVFDIQATVVEDDNQYVFTFKIKGKAIKHKFVLTFSRVFFEFPYNELARDVFKLRALGKFDGIDYSHKNFLDLFNALCGTYVSFGAGHSLYEYPATNTKNKVLKEVFSKGRSQVQEVYDSHRDTGHAMKRPGDLYRIDWDSNFEKRAAVYSENFKKIIELKKKQNEVQNIRRRARKVL